MQEQGKYLESFILAAQLAHFFVRGHKICASADVLELWEFHPFLFLLLFLFSCAPFVMFVFIFAAIILLYCGSSCGGFVSALAFFCLYTCVLWW